MCSHGRCIAGTCLGPNFNRVPYITFPDLVHEQVGCQSFHEVCLPQRVCCNPHVLRKSQIPCPSNAKKGVCWKNTKQCLQILLRGFLQECGELSCKVNSSITKGANLHRKQPCNLLKAQRCSKYCASLATPRRAESTF